MSQLFTFACCNVKNHTHRLMVVNYFSLKKSLFLLVIIYLVYLTKSALGIDLLEGYALPEFVKYPLVIADCTVHLKVNFCK